MGRRRDLDRRDELLDQALAHLARRGIEGTSLRDLADDLGIALNSLVHHFGTRDDLIVVCLEHAERTQLDVVGRWTRRNPTLSATAILRRWWRWIVASPENLAIARLHLEVAALRPEEHPWIERVDVDRIAVWRQGIADRLVRDGLIRRRATNEATALRALMSGLILELAAGGDRRRLGLGLELSLSRLDQLLASLEPVVAPVPPVPPPRPRPPARSKAPVPPGRPNGRRLPT